jgi:hypothetical protein
VRLAALAADLLGFGWSISIEATDRDSGWASCQLEQLEPKKVLAVDVVLSGTVLTVHFDDASDDAVSLAITPTGYDVTGANVSSGSGPITQLIVTDNGTLNPSSFSLTNASQVLTAGLSIDPEIDAATIASDVSTAGGDVSIDSATLNLSANISTGAASQVYTANVTLLSDATLTGNTGSFAGGLNGAGYDLTLNFSGLSTIDGGFANINDLTVTGPASLNGSIATSNVVSRLQYTATFDGVANDTNGTGLNDGSNIVGTNGTVTSVQTASDFTALRLTEDGVATRCQTGFCQTSIPAKRFRGSA